MTLDCFALRLFSFVFHTIKAALTLRGHRSRPLFLGAHVLRTPDPDFCWTCTRASTKSLLKYLICGHDSLSCCSVSHVCRSDGLRGVLCERADVIGGFTALWWPIWWNGGKCDEPALWRGGWTLAIIPSIAPHPSPPYSRSLISPHHFCSFCCSSHQSPVCPLLSFIFVFPTLHFFLPPPFFLTSRSAAPGLFGCW